MAFAVFQKPESVEGWRSDRIIQSWDTASTDGKWSDYSACITFPVSGNTYYILDVLRKKLTELAALAHDASNKALQQRQIEMGRVAPDVERMTHVLC